MRTTLTLDDDVARRIEELREKRGGPLDPLVNELLRRGLEIVDRKLNRRPFVQRTLSVGGVRQTCLDDIAEVLSLVESRTDQTQRS